MSTPPLADPATHDTRVLGRWFTGIRREGFLAALSADRWHTLSAILSFTSRDGLRPFTPEQLALALGVPRAQAESRLEDLATAGWQGHPLIVILRDLTGTVCGAEVASLEQLALTHPASGDAIDENSATETLPADLIEALHEVGLNHAQIDSLARRFPENEICRQLDWLPARKARNPAALLIRAIEQDWDEPKEGQ